MCHLSLGLAFDAYLWLEFQMSSAADKGTDRMELARFIHSKRQLKYL